jgi:hypothetical protein
MAKGGKKFSGRKKEKQEGWTKTPNKYFDKVLRLGGVPASVKLITLVVIRLTSGWRRDAAYISIREFKYWTGYSSETVIEAVRTAMELGFIDRVKSGSRFIYKYGRFTEEDYARLMIEGQES